VFFKQNYRGVRPVGTVNGRFGMSDARVNSIAKTKTFSRKSLKTDGARFFYVSGKPTEWRRAPFSGETVKTFDVRRIVCRIIATGGEYVANHMRDLTLAFLVCPEMFTRDRIYTQIYTRKVRGIIIFLFYLFFFRFFA